MDGIFGKRRSSRSATLLALAVLAGAAAGQVTLRVSVATGGAEGNGSVQDRIAISHDGRCVAFASLASNLVPLDANARSDVFVHDLQAGTTECVSVDAGGLPGNARSVIDSISADGRLVAFSSRASNLVPGDANGADDTFLRDRLTGTTELVSVSSTGVQGNTDSYGASLSADGRYVVFVSGATTLVPGDTNNSDDVFLRDRVLGTTERVNLGPGGVQANDSGDRGTAVSADGRYVAFWSLATNLVAGDTNAAADVFVRDRQLGTTELVSVDTTGGSANDHSVDPTMSTDGRFVAFVSEASDLVAGDTGGWIDVFVRDRLAGTTRRVSVDSSGTAWNDHSQEGALSPDGRHVAYVTFSAGVLLHDLATGTTENVSIDALGAERWGDFPAVAAGGRSVAFRSEEDLVSGDTNGYSDAFVRQRTTDAGTPFCFGDGLDATHTTPCPCNNEGAAGQGCASSVNPSGASLGTLGDVAQDSVELHGAGMPSTSTCIYLQGDALADETFGDGVRCTGGTLLRLRTRTNALGASSFPDSTETITLSARGGVVVGSGARRYYQTYYRNAAPLFCPPETFNVTNGVVVDW